jgi:uncharacterized phage protein (TIGR01671 family)
MREIKFRAYYEGKWRKVRSLIFHQKLEWVTLEGIDGSVSIELVNLVEFTGLKDKNGKEIYEGDILNWEYDTDKKYPWQVCFENGCFIRILKNIYPNKKEPISERIEGFTIIGNIYENPELLKEQEQ